MRAKKFLAMCLGGAFCIAAFGGCAGGEEKPTPPPDDEKPPVVEDDRVEIMGDTDFSTGIHLLGTDAGEDGRTTYRKLTWGGTAEETETPVWVMAQWCSKYDMSDELDAGRTVEQKEGDTYIYEDPSKTLKFNTKTRAIDLIYRASVDYDTPRVGDQGWSHLLLEQNFADSPLISELSEVHVAMDFTINQMDRKMTDEEYDFNLHTAQLVWFITLTNMSDTHGTPGDYIWFGVPLYDARGMAREDTVQYDKGTAHYIYGVAVHNYMDEYIESSTFDTDYLPIKTDIKFDYNIYPLFKSAFEHVQQNGGMQGARFEDMAVTYMNMGWEIPGTYDVGVTIRGMDIYGIKK